MQTILPFAVISIFFSAFKILLVGAFGGILSVYAASGSTYGNSIRWSRQGGYREMATVLWNSIRHVPRSTTVGMIVAIIASILALFSSVFFTPTVHRSDIKVNTSHIGIKTMQFMLTGSRNDQWTAYLAYGSKAEDALGSMINDTRNLADAVPGRRYTPRTFGYEVACDSIQIGVLRTLSDILPQVVGGCSAVILKVANPYFDWDPKTAINVRSASDQYTIVASVKFPKGVIMLEPRFPSFFYYQYECISSTFGYSEGETRYFQKFPDSGMTSLPRTSLYKCQYPSGALYVVSQTQMTLAVQTLAEYDNIITTIFDDSSQLPLLATMSPFIKNGTFSDPQSNSTMVTLTKAGANVHFLMCYSLRSSMSADKGLLCSYNVVNAIMTTPQAEDPIIAADLIGRRVVAANVSVNQNAVWLGHLPMNLTSSARTFSVSSILNATLSGAQYLASLGQNFVMDRESRQLYVLFDTVDIKDGYEFSTGLFVALVVVMVLCAGFWAYTEKALKSMHTGSLYKLVYKRSKPRREKPAPMLMCCTHDPLAFEGGPIDEILEDPSQQEFTSTSAARLISDAVAI